MQIKYKKEFLETFKEIDGLLIIPLISRGSISINKKQKTKKFQEIISYHWKISEVS